MTDGRINPEASVINLFPRNIKQNAYCSVNVWIFPDWFINVVISPEILQFPFVTLNIHALLCDVPLQNLIFVIPDGALKYTFWLDVKFIIVVPAINYCHVSQLSIDVSNCILSLKLVPRVIDTAAPESKHVMQKYLFSLGGSGFSQTSRPLMEKFLTSRPFILNELYIGYSESSYVAVAIIDET